MIDINKKFDKYVREEGRSVQVGVEGANFMHLLRVKIENDPKYDKICLWDYKTEPGSDLNEWLGLMVKNSDRSFTGVGVILDIDKLGATARADRVSSTQSIIKKHYKRDVDELIVDKGDPCLGFFVIPQGTNEGCLETALLENPKQKYISCAEDFVTCATAIESKNENKIAKMKVRAMTFAEDPDMSFAATAEKDLWDWDKGSLKEMLLFLQNMNNAAP